MARPLSRQDVALPPTVAARAYQETKNALKDILGELDKATSGEVDFPSACRQIKRLSVMSGLHAELLDEEVARIVAMLLRVVFLEGILISQQCTLLKELNGQLTRAKKRNLTLPPIDWRPFYACVDAHYQSHVVVVGAEAPSGAVHSSVLMDCIRAASWFFPPTAIAEIVALTTPHLAQVNTNAVAVAQATLWLFLPGWARLSHLPKGIPAYWMRVWGWFDTLAVWNDVWASLFARIANADWLEDGVPSMDVYDATGHALASAPGAAAAASTAAGGDGAAALASKPDHGSGERLLAALRDCGALPPAAAGTVAPTTVMSGGRPYLVVDAVFRWGDYVPFLTARLQQVINAPVNGVAAALRAYPPEASAMLGSWGQNRGRNMGHFPHLLARLLTVDVPPAAALAHGDAPPAHLAACIAATGISYDDEEDYVDVPGTAASAGSASDPFDAPSATTTPRVLSSTSSSYSMGAAASAAADVKSPVSYPFDASVMGSLERLLRALGTYFYPSSPLAGRFATLLRCFLQPVLERYGDEVGRARAAVVTEALDASVEAAGGAAGGDAAAGAAAAVACPLHPSKAPASAYAVAKRLTRPLLRRFVDATLPLAVQGLYLSTSGNMDDVSESFRALASLAPHRVCGEVVSFASLALDPTTLNETHMAPNAMHVLGLVIQSLLFPVPHILPHLPHLLVSALPGVDPNDEYKSGCALYFYTKICGKLPLLHEDDVAADAAARATAAAGGAGTRVGDVWMFSGKYTGTDADTGNPWLTPINCGGHTPPLRAPSASSGAGGSALHRASSADDVTSSTGIPHEDVWLPAWHPASPAYVYGPAAGPRGVARFDGTVGYYGLADIPQTAAARSGSTSAAGGSPTAGGSALVRVPSTGGSTSGTAATAASLAAPAPGDQRIVYGRVTEKPLRSLYQACRTALPTLADWVLQLYDRIFRLLEAREAPQTRSKAAAAGRRMTRAAQSEGYTNTTLRRVLQQMPAQMSPRLLQQVTTRVQGWVSSVSCLESAKIVGWMIGGLAAAGGRYILDRFVPTLTDGIQVAAAPAEPATPPAAAAAGAASATAASSLPSAAAIRKAKASSQPSAMSDKLLQWRLQLLLGLLEHTGDEALPHLKALAAAIHVGAYQVDVEKKTRKLAGKLLRRLLQHFLTETKVDATSLLSHTLEDMSAPSALWWKIGVPYANPGILVVHASRGDAIERWRAVRPLAGDGTAAGAPSSGPAVGAHYQSLLALSTATSGRSPQLVGFGSPQEIQVALAGTGGPRAAATVANLTQWLRFSPPLATVHMALPSEATRTAALALVNTFLVPAVLRLRAGADLDDRATSGAETRPLWAAARPPLLPQLHVATNSTAPPADAPTGTFGGTTSDGDDATAFSVPGPASDPIKRSVAPLGASGGASTSTAFSAVIREGEKFRADCELMLAAVRGLLHGALPDTGDVDGDDGIFATGSAGMALMWDLAAQAAHYATEQTATASPAATTTLRHFLVTTVAGMGRFILGHADLARDTRAVTLITKLIQRLYTGRGPRLSKVQQIVRSLSSIDDQDTEIFSSRQTHTLRESLLAWEREHLGTMQGAAGEGVVATDADGLQQQFVGARVSAPKLWCLDSFPQSQFRRPFDVMMLRRGEAVFAVPRALHDLPKNGAAALAATGAGAADKASSQAAMLAGLLCANTAGLSLGIQVDMETLDDDGDNWEDEDAGRAAGDDESPDNAGGSAAFDAVVDAAVPATLSSPSAQSVDGAADASTSAAAYPATPAASGTGTSLAEAPLLMPSPSSARAAGSAFTAARAKSILASWSAAAAAVDTKYTRQYVGAEAIAKAPVCELPYLELMSVLLQFTRHSYDTARSKANSYFPSIVAVMPWLKRSLTRVSLRALEAAIAEARATAPPALAAGASRPGAAAAAGFSAQEFGPLLAAFAALGASLPADDAGSPQSVLKAAISKTLAEIAAAGSAAAAVGIVSRALAALPPAAAELVQTAIPAAAALRAAGAAAAATGAGGDSSSAPTSRGAADADTVPPYHVLVGHAAILYGDPRGLAAPPAMRSALMTVLRSPALVRRVRLDKQRLVQANLDYVAQVLVASVMEAQRAAAPVLTVTHGGAACAQLSTSAAVSKFSRHSASRLKTLLDLLAIARPDAFASAETSSASATGDTDAAVDASNVRAPAAAGGSVAMAQNADGTRSASAAPLAPSPLHWRVELGVVGLASALLAPCAWSDTITAGFVAGVPGAVKYEAGKATPGWFPAAEAPEAVWLWILSLLLSDHVFIRECGFALFSTLLSARAERLRAKLPALPLPRVQRLLEAVDDDGRYVSQMVMALSLNHVAALQKAEGSSDTGTGGFSLPSPRAAVESASSSLRGEAVSSTHHALLFQDLLALFPGVLKPVLKALQQLVPMPADSTANGHAAAAADAGEDEADDGDAAAGSADASAGAAGASAGGHDLASLRVRKATVSEALCGFLRTLSAQTRPCSCPDSGCTCEGGADGPLLCVPRSAASYSLADASLGVLKSHYNHAAAASPAAGASGVPVINVHAAMIDVLAVAAPIMSSLPIARTADFSNMLRLATRQRHPCQVAPLVRFVYANAAKAIGMKQELLTAAVDSAHWNEYVATLLPAADAAHNAATEGLARLDRTHLRTLLEQSRAAFAGAVGSPSAPAPAAVSVAADASPALASASATTATASIANSTAAFAAIQRWLDFAMALHMEFSASEAIDGLSGANIGISVADDAARELVPWRVSGVATPVSGCVANGHALPGVSHPLPHVANLGLAVPLLPALLLSFGHPYQASRCACVNFVGLLIEDAWTPAEDSAASPLAMSHTGGAAAAPGFQQSLKRSQWSAPIMAAAVLLTQAAAPPGSKSSTDKTEAPAAAAGVAAAGPSPAERWCESVCQASLTLANFSNETPIVAGMAAPFLFAPVFNLHSHPKTEISGLAAIVCSKLSQTLVFAAPHAADAASACALALSVDALGASAPAGAVASAGKPSNILAFVCDRIAQGSRNTAAVSAVDDGEAGAVQVAASASAGAAAAVAEAAAVVVGSQPRVAAAAATTTGIADAAAAAAGSDSVPVAAAWTVRRAALTFAVPVRSRSLMALSRSQDETIQGIIEACLNDKQVEVQVAASKALVAFVMTMSHDGQRALLDKYAPLTSTKLPRKVVAPTSFATASPAEVDAYKSYKTKLAKALRKRHAGILGEASVVLAHPFDVPEFLPATLSALAKHISDPQPVAASVKRIFSEFKHTHLSDTGTWEKQKLAFTSDQLTDLVELLVSAHYYA